MTTTRISLHSRRARFVLVTLFIAGMAGTSSWPARGQDPPPTPTPVADGADPQGAPAQAGDQTDPQGRRS